MKSGNVKSGRTGNITIDEALEVLRKQYNCWITAPHECPIQCEKCENDVDFADFLEASKTVLDSFGNHSELPNSSDLVSRSYLLAEYDRQHVGPPGGARKIIAEAPSIVPQCKLGHWIYGEHDVAMTDGYHCDQCGFFVPWDYQHKFIDFIKDYHYCPSCGNPMEEGEP